MRITKTDKVQAENLRILADSFLQNPEAISPEAGKALDRALRTCRGISDIDVVWVGWRYYAAKHGWLTDHELVISNGKYEYPLKGS